MDQTLVTIAETETIEEAFRRLNLNMLGILFAQDSRGRVVGAVTDGDIRRKLLDGVSLRDQVATCVNRDFVWANAGAPREQILKLLDQRVHVVPILDLEQRLVDVFSRDMFNLGEESVKTYLERAFTKLGVSRRAEAVSEAHKLGLLGHL